MSFFQALFIQGCYMALFLFKTEVSQAFCSKKKFSSASGALISFCFNLVFCDEISNFVKMLTISLLESSLASVFNLIFWELSLLMLCLHVLFAVINTVVRCRWLLFHLRVSKMRQWGRFRRHVYQKESFPLSLVSAAKMTIIRTWC